MTDNFSQGTVHDAGHDMRDAILADDEVADLWESLTPLARNEFICWVVAHAKNCWRDSGVLVAGRVVFIAPTKSLAVGKRPF